VGDDNLMRRIDDLEFRWSKFNQKYELLRWFEPEKGEKEYCIVIAFFDKTSDGCEIRFVGKRPFEVEKDETVWSMLKYGQAIVDAECSLDWEVNH
jgi:hypothetical protein